MGFPLAATLWGSWRSFYLVILVILVANWVLNVFVLKDGPKPVARASIVFSSVLTPPYGSLVDQTGSFFIPGLISIGIAAVTFLVLIISTKETYGSIVRD